MTTPLAEVRDYDGLLEAVRARVDALGAPYSSIEEYAGLTNGHLGKILGRSQVKVLGVVTVFKLMDALGLRFDVVEHLDIDATKDEMDHHYRPRQDNLRSNKGVIRKHIAEDVKSLVARAMGARGGLSQKRFRLSIKERAAINRQNVRKRKWRPVKLRHKLGRN